MTDRTDIVSLAFTGASGAPYGLRLLQCLLESNCKVYLMISEPGQMVINMETDLGLPSKKSSIEQRLSEHFGAEKGQLRVFGREEWTAPVASGSGAPGAMVICPCTTGTLSSIAQGSSRNLIERAADVVIKEQRKLVLVVRETPLSPVHLENMLKLAKIGVVILPPSPGFYHGIADVGSMIDFVVARILDQLGISHQLVPVWGEAFDPP